MAPFTRKLYDSEFLDEYATCPPLLNRSKNEISKIRYLNKAGGTRPAMA